MEKENDLKDSIEPVNIESTTRILSQMISCICKIKIKERIGTGFFCKIPFRKDIINVLMTNYHFLNEKDFKDNKKLDYMMKKNLWKWNLNKKEKHFLIKNMM